VEQNDGASKVRFADEQPEASPKNGDAAEAKPAETAEEAEAPEEPKIQSEEEALKFREEANQCMKDGEFEKGIDLYSAICKFYVAKYGATAGECAQPYYDYGEAILYQMQELHSVLEGEEPAEDAQGENVADGTLALEALELAQQLYSRAVEERKKNAEGAADELREAELKLALVHLKLGDLWLEQEQWQNAIDDYLKCADVRTKHLKPDDQKLVEVFYQLGMAYEWNQTLSTAVEYYRKAHAVLKDDPSRADLAEDLRLKIIDASEEAKTTEAEEAKVKEMLKDAIVGMAPTQNNDVHATPFTAMTPLQLQSLSPSELKALAAKHGVDVSQCCEKADVVSTLVQHIEKAKALSSPATSAAAASSSSTFSAAASAAPAPAFSFASASSGAFTFTSSSTGPSAAPPSCASSPTNVLAPRKRVRPVQPMDGNAEPTGEPPAAKRKLEDSTA
jgi:tetratricopeptide (TPR) repeat protein